MCPLEKTTIDHLNLQKVSLMYQANLVDDKALITTLNESKCQTVFIEGKIGTGKTSLVQQILHSEKLHDFLVVVYCRLDYDPCRQVRTWKDLSTILDTSESQLHEIENMESDTLFIFDEFDDFVQNYEWETTIFADILLRKIFTNSSIVVVSRPSGLSSLEEYNHLKVDHHFQIKGFLNSTALKFQDHWIVTMCEQHKIILDMCEVPLINELVNKFFEQGNSDDTFTDLLMFVVTEILKRESSETSYSDLKLLNLPNGIKSNFENLSKLAFESYVNDHKFSSFEEINRFLSAFSLNNSFSMNDCKNFGLIERVLTDLSDPNSCRIEFLHPVIGDFLAGFYLHLQPPLDQFELIHQHTSLLLCQSHYIMQFFFGLTWRKNSELDLNPSKLMFNTLIEFLAYCLNQELQDSDHGLLLTLCIAETKDSELWKKLVSKLGSDLKLRLSSDDISRHKWTIASMVSCSQVREWNIQASNFSLCDELEPYIGARLNKVEVPSMEESVIILSPKVTIEVTSKQQRDAEKFTQSVQVMNKFQCQAICEILQRSFAMYTERMRLKGDSSNPAYVSFLSCECFQKNFEKNLKFDPPLPSHFLQVNSAKTLKKLQEEHGVHLASHGGKAIELVILLKPYLRRVTLTYKSKVHHIIMMSEELVQKTVSEGAIEQACMTGTDLMEHIMCTEEAPTASEMVRPSLPLPPIGEQNLKTTTVLPQVTIAGASPAPRSVLEEKFKHDKLQKLRESQRSQAGAMIYNASSGSGSPQTFHLQFTSRQQQQITTVTTSQPTQGIRSSIKPGAILFTSIPEQMPSDHMHPLPDETNQIRRGGNGQIFRGTIGRMSVVYKKTNYRSREFTIIIKLKHKNIIKLLAFMYGEENPAHRRRHFCYHIMPQMSGDCARMLTDKRELTIKELHKKHGDNIRKMGVIRGNLKYLLKEILHGLQYLHSLQITHRDIKGSNILLKFFCSCTNPLECGCDSKYQVQICDFDAAIELDENERLPPTQVGSRISSRPSYNHYISVPVGTNGFRSPECSMLAISNVTDVFYPPINTRSDIWSFGILTLRILIGATGPSSQREMALLLLHYYQQRYMHEGLHRRLDCFGVDRLVTDKLLSVSQFIVIAGLYICTWLNVLIFITAQIPKLVREVGWLKGAVRFIECCVAVDPFSRHSADALLQHDFLY